MKFYIEKDSENKVIAKGITSKDAVIEAPLLEVSEEEFNELEQYKPSVNIEQFKTEKITQSKQKLAEFLESNPLEYNNEFFSVTQEKQALLTSAIAAYQLKVQAGVPATLKWNTTGDICREFSLEEITGLVIAITDYVQPRVEKQQEIEVQIMNATTMGELEGIEIDYEVV